MRAPELCPGAASKVVTSPLSVIGLNAAVGGQQQGLYAVFRQILKEGGLRSFWRGSTQHGGRGRLRARRAGGAG
jgi:hypothetical protein